MPRSVSKRTTRRTALVVTAVAAGTLAAPLSAATAAPTPAGGYRLVLSDTDGDYSAGIYRVAADGTQTAVVPEDPDVTVDGLTTSADGSRFAYTRETYTQTSDRSSVVVADISGSTVRTVDTAVTTFPASGPPSSFVADFAPALSPDGTVVVWNRGTIDFAAGTQDFDTRRAAVASGGATVVRGGKDVLVSRFLDASTLIGDPLNATRNDIGPAVTLPVAGGSTTPVSGISGRTHDYVVSPDGSTLAWSDDTTPPYDPSSTASPPPSTSDVKTATLTLANGTATLTNVATFATGTNNSSPSWSTDGSALAFVKYDGANGQGDVWSGPLDGSTVAAPDPATPGKDELLLARGVAESTAPDASTLVPATLAGTSATIRWTLPTTSADASGVMLSRAGKTVYAAGTSYVDTGLTVGTTYTYTVATVDRSGNVGPASPPRQVTATAAPTLTVADPTSTKSAGTPFAVGFSTVDASGTTYVASYRNVSSSTVSAWTSTTARSATFGAGGRPVTVAPGAVYELRGSARDTHGNSTATVVGRTRAVVPFDQTKAAFTSTAATVRGSYRYLGSARVLTKAGQTATLTVTGNRLQVVGERSTSGGSFDVYLRGSNGAYTRVKAGVSTYGSAAARSVLYTYASTTSATRTFQLRWVKGSTTTRKNVVVDAFGVRR